LKNNKNEDACKLSVAEQFDVLSKKIVCKFFRNSLFTRLSIIDYDGWIKGQGDVVRMVDHTELIIDQAIPIEEDFDPAIFGDMTLIDIVTTRIASQLKDKVEKAIIGAPSMVGDRLYFVCQVVPMGGFEPKGLGMKFVYGFKIA
jgi:hypothetical protein